MTERVADNIGVLGWLWRFAFAAVLLFSVANWIAWVSAAATNAPISSRESIGVAYGPTTVEERGWTGIARVEPHGPADAAGIRAGDSIRFEASAGSAGVWSPGEQVRLQVARGGQRFTETLTAGRPTTNLQVRSLTLVVGALQALAMLAIASVLLVQGSGNRAAVLLSAILLVQGANPAGILLPLEATMPVVLIVSLFLEVSIGFAWPLFCLAISGGTADQRQVRFVTLASVLFAGTNALVIADGLLRPGLPNWIYPAFVILHQAFGYAVIAYNYRRNDALSRNRLKIVLLAFVCLLIGVVVANWSPGIWQSLGLALLRIVAACLLVYALLRHRLFDLNFVLNRTLVYGAVSFILLASFGLAEWGIKHLLPEAWLKESALYSAAIALVLFLSIHRLRDWVDHHVERVFFHGWHVNEATLRRFVASASAFASAPALYREFAGEVSRFAQGAPAAIYVREESNDFKRIAGKIPGANARYPEDERLFALLRTERRAVEPGAAHSAVPGALAVPVLDQGTLAGFVLVGGKRDGTHFRPDEVEVLEWAAHQVGVDLRAIQARELATENARLSKSLRTIEAERDRLLGVLKPAEVHKLKA